MKEIIGENFYDFSLSKLFMNTTLNHMKQNVRPENDLKKENNPQNQNLQIIYLIEDLYLDYKELCQLNKSK